MWRCIIICCGLWLAACSGVTEAPAPIDISNLVSETGVETDRSALKIIRLSDGQIWQSGQARLTDRYPPASTSKIPHTLIMIEDDMATPDTQFKWDGTTRFVDNWNRDQTLASAFRYSTVWVYQDLVAKQGYEAMQDWMTRLNYGNAYIGDASDVTTYWLRGPLEISVDEQINFLTGLTTRDLPFSEATYSAALPLMIETQTDDYILYAKTGWRHDGESMDIGWYVGWVETQYNGQPDIYVFAFNMDMPDGAGRNKRKTLVKSALASIGAFPN